MKLILTLISFLSFVACSTTTSKNKFTCAQGDCENGIGRFVYSNGDSYEGKIKNSKANGKGTAFHSNGNILEGFWEDDYLIDGTLYYANGDQFTGSFKKTREFNFIYGEYIWNHGQIYTGNWKGLLRHGLGVEYYKDGSIYLGEHHNDQRDGPGILFKQDGSQIGGFWENNNINTPIENFKFENLLEALDEHPSQRMMDLINNKVSIVDTKKRFSNNYTITKNITIDTNPSFVRENISPIIKLHKKEYMLESEIFTIRGEVYDESDIVIFAINGEEISLLKDRSFEKQLYVPIGRSEIILTAVDKWENVKIETVIINRTYNKKNLLKKPKENLNPTLLISKKNKNRVALILGVNNYETLTDLPFAENDANFFYDYAVNTLGIPPENIIRVVNTELKDMYKALNNLQKMINEKSHLFVYYAGHGLNYQSDNRLLAADFDVSVIQQTSLLQSEFIDIIAQTNPHLVTIIFDTCFSGINRGGEQLVDARFVSIAESAVNIPNNFLVISSSSNLEWSRDHSEQDHGLFTYYFLKGLEKKADTNKDKQITLNELFAYTKKNVQQDSNFHQNPEMSSHSDYVLVDWN